MAVRSSAAPQAAAVTGYQDPAPVGSGPVVAQEAAVRARDWAPGWEQVAPVPVLVLEARAPVALEPARRSFVALRRG